MGMYAPIILGEIEGFKVGINTNLILWEHTRQLDYTQLEGEWLVGFGVGFNKGQNSRRKLLEGATEELISERVDAVLYLLEKVDYGVFENKLLKHLENLNNWKSKRISAEVVQTSRAFIKENILQRALQEIERYYEEKFRLIALIEYAQFSNRLNDLRSIKRLKNISNEAYLIEKLKIKSDLENWIDKNIVR